MRSSSDRVTEDPQARDKDGPAPIHLAAITGQSEVVAELIGAGVAVNLPIMIGNTPLQLAENAGKMGVASLLRRTAAPCENGVVGGRILAVLWSNPNHFTPPQYFEQLSLN